VAKRFWTSFNIWLSSALDLEVFELTPKETALGIFSDESSCKKLFHFYSLWQEIIFTVVNGLAQNQSLTFSKLGLNKKRKSKRLMHLLKIKCTNMIINGVTLHELNL
jgi:hypothetical protein